MLLGTPGYFPEASSWLNGNRKWDMWALVAMICEADMKKDAYIWNNERSRS